VQRFAGVSRGLAMKQDDGIIYIKVKDDLIRFATVLVGRDHAEDVVSVVMVRLLRKRSLASLGEPRAYLFRSVLNESRGLLRSVGARYRSEPGMTWAMNGVFVQLTRPVS
jgi:DNA-directed RNA polymerase specialized sigma24 family protein